VSATLLSTPFDLKSLDMVRVIEDNTDKSIALENGEPS